MTEGEGISRCRNLPCLPRSRMTSVDTVASYSSPGVIFLLCLASRFLPSWSGVVLRIGGDVLWRRRMTFVSLCGISSTFSFPEAPKAPKKDGDLATAALFYLLKHESGVSKWHGRRHRYLLIPSLTFFRDCPLRSSIFFVTRFSGKSLPPPLLGVKRGATAQSGRS